MRFDLLESIEAMRAGRKTQTRRRSASWLKKQPGDRITIVHKGAYLGYATVRQVYSQAQWTMTQAEAIDEGYPDKDRFWEAWRQLYPNEPIPHRFVVIEFGDIRWRKERKDALVDSRRA